MANEQLLAYVKAQRAKGVSDEAIKAAILKIGWPPKDADEAMEEGVAVPSVAQAMEGKPVSTDSAFAAPPVKEAAMADKPAAPATPSTPTPIPAAQSPAETTPSRTRITPDALTNPAGAPAIIPSSELPASALSPKTAPIAGAGIPVDSISPSVPIAPTAPADAASVLQLPTDSVAAAPEIVPINPEPEPSAAKPASHRTPSFAVALLIVLIVGVAGFGYWYVTREKAPADTTAVEDFSAAVPAPAALPEEEPAAAPTPSADDIDIADAKNVFEIIREANVKKDTALERQYLSAQTLTTVASSTKWKPVWYKDLELLSAAKEGEVVVMSIVSIKENGATSTAETVFVKEETGWKLGIMESLQRALLPKAAGTATSTASSTPTSTQQKSPVAPAPTSTPKAASSTGR
ncbi:MAG: hypothetical protein HYW65_02400 [Candidatus Liptonbacteria bacterium]|nr:hypothetical protein [Candidatus Liptonbacteria bacterium]